MNKKITMKTMLIIAIIAICLVVSSIVVLVVQNKQVNSFEDICTDDCCVEVDLCENYVTCECCEGYGVWAGYIGVCDVCFGEDENCTTCAGTGEVMYQGPFICVVCDGTGVVCLE